ncbi:MAG: SPOR domain-containing protein [Rubrivivax sp.]|jgi:cell division protein FtsN
MNATPQRAGLSSQRGGFVMGLVVGLLVGLALALGVALYITKAPVPFINKVPQRTAEQDNAETERNKNWDPNAPLAGKGVQRPATSASGVVGGPAAAGSAAVATAPAAAPASGAKASGSTRDPAALLAGAAVPASGAKPALTFFVQAGAYTRAEDAEQQRAKLALSGLSAKVSEREQSGRTVYRVRLGPFDTREEAEGLQTKLTESNIEARLVAVEKQP